MKNILKKFSLVTLFQGFVMGIAEIIPGVSGSTMALIMGIYDDFIFLLDQISQFIKYILKFILRRVSVVEVKKSFLAINFKFGIVLGLGMVLTLAVLSNVITFLLEGYTQYVFAFFFGLVLVSIKIPWKQMSKKGLREFPILFITFVLAFIILGLKPVELDQSPTLPYLFLSGALAICAMVLPGVSGSFIFLILGVYPFVISQLKSLTRLEINADGLLSLIVLGFGIVFGFSVFVRFLKVAYKKYTSQLMAFLIGLMLGSLRVVYPFIEYDPNLSPSLMQKVLPWERDAFEVLLIVVIVLIAVVVVYLLERVSSKN